MKHLITSLLAVFVVALMFGCGDPGTETPEAVDAAEAPVSEEVVAVEESSMVSDDWILSEGLEKPESAIYDAPREAIYVSNIVGEGDAMDGNGYIAKVTADGSLIESRWVEGLNGPKGMALWNGNLLSTDIDALVVINPDEAVITDRFTLDGDVYLNDVTVGPDGSVFVTDSRYSKVYKLDDSGLSLWLEDEKIQMPNGLHVIGDYLYIVAGDSSAENPGAERYMQRISLTDKTIEPVRGTEPMGALDAVEPDGKGGIFVSNWGNGQLYHFTEEGGYTLLRQLGQGCADVDYNSERHMLYVPVMMEHELRAYDVKLD